MASDKENKEFISAVLDQDDVLNDAIDWISVNFKPDAIFLQCELEQWAKDNGYIKEDDE